MSLKLGFSRLALVAALACAVGPTALAAPAGPAGKIGATPAPTGPAPVPSSPIADKATPTPPMLPDMTSYVLMDAKTGAIIAEADPHLRVPPASLTKLMTAHLVYQALHNGSLKMDQIVPVSVAAWHAPGSTMFIDPNSKVTVNDLLHGLLIDSGNDAAIALAEQVAGSQDAFVQIMNHTAKKLDLTDTTYTNPTGLPSPDLRTSAMDVAKLSRVILQDEPQILQIAKQPSYTWDNITQANWNPVLKVDPTVDGLKTGLTDESGHCIDATAKRGNMRLIAVVMGGTTWASSTSAIEALLDYGQHFFTDAQIATKGAQLGLLQSSLLQAGSVPVGAQKDIVITLPKDEAKTITHSITYTADLTPGVSKGEVLGTITFSAGGQQLASVPAVALSNAPKASFFTKLKRKLGHML